MPCVSKPRQPAGGSELVITMAAAVGNTVSQNRASLSALPVQGSPFTPCAVGAFFWLYPYRDTKTRPNYYPFAGVAATLADTNPNRHAPMFIRAYLRASTAEQDATRARASLEGFGPVAAWYVETASGTSADRPELRRLLSDAQPGDVLLIESIDRLTRLPADEWKRLRAEIEGKGLRVVAVDLPTSHQALTSADEFTDRVLDAANRMLVDVVAAMARKDWEQRRERQRQGIEKAKAAGKYTGRPQDTAKRRRVARLLEAGLSVRQVAKLTPCSTSTVQAVKRHQPDTPTRQNPT